jgi:hypothetical protein
MPRWALPFVMAVSAVALGGCAIVGSSSGMSASCDDLPGGACSEQIDRAGARHPGATSVDLTCGVPVCDRRGGAGTAVVTLRDGSTVVDTFTYTGDPGPVPRPSCLKLAFAACQALADQQVDQAPPSKRIARIKVTCTAAQCTEAAGEAEVELAFADGSVTSGGSSWEGGLP